MPDPLKKTVSASQVAALFNLSPYETRWSMWQWFRKSIEIDQENSRTDFGKFVEPFIMAQVQEMLRLEVIHNKANAYHRAGPLGCTADARVFDPTRGPGVVQAKAHGYPAWRESFTESMCPRHVELQLQTEMAVVGAQWGMVAVMIGQNDKVLLYEREPNKELQQRIADEATAFLASVEANEPPDPFGAAVELPILDQLYREVIPKKIIELSDLDIAEAARMMAWSGEQQLFHKRIYDQKRAIVAAAIGDAERLILPGVTVEASRSVVKESTVSLPADIAIGLTQTLVNAPPGFDVEPIKAAATWSKVGREESVRTKFKIFITEEQPQEEAQWLTP